MRNAALLMVLLIHSGCGAASELPERTDCIAAVSLNWQSDTPLATRARVVEQIVRNAHTTKSDNVPMFSNPKDD